MATAEDGRVPKLRGRAAHLVGYEMDEDGEPRRLTLRQTEQIRRYLEDLGKHARKLYSRDAEVIVLKVVMQLLLISDRATAIADTAAYCGCDRSTVTAMLEHFEQNKRPRHDDFETPKTAFLLHVRGV